MSDEKAEHPLCALENQDTAEISVNATESHIEEATSSVHDDKVQMQEHSASCEELQTQFFDSVISLNTSISTLEETTKSNFVVLYKSKYFGDEDLKATGKERILWRSQNEKRGTLISFTGVPYVVVGRKILQCHLGKELKRHINTVDENQHEDHSFKRHRQIVQNTKKMGCSAEIYIIHFIRFPDFKIEIDTVRRRKTCSKKLKLALLKNVDTVKTSHGYVARFPVQSDHKFHATTGEVANLREKVDIRVKEKIINLHRGGVRKISEMRRHINTYVSTEMFPDSDVSIEYRRRFYPTRKDICNIMAKAKSSTHTSSVDQSNLLHLVHEWQKENTTLNIYYRPNTATEEECNEQTFLFCYQTEWQKRLLQLYGNHMTLFDATYRTTRYALPLFFLCVRTNVCYVVVGAFVTQYENSQSILEALAMFKSWNVNWKPTCFLVDFCLEEINAVSKVFPDSKILLCEFHREKAWMEWVNKKDHKVRDFRKAVLKMLRDIANSRSMEEHNVALQTLTNSDVWKKTSELRQWFSNKWLPEIAKWARVYRSGMFQVGIHTNNGLERQHEILKYTHLEGYKNCSLSEMISVLHSSFFPNTYKKYVELNVQSSKLYRKYKQDIPKFLQNRPREIINHIMRRMSSTLDLTNVVCVNSALGIFSVDGETEKGKKYSVNLGEETPFCTCVDWGNFLLPCKHMCCIIQYISDWGWDRLRKSYTENPLFTIDVHCFKQEVKEETVEGPHHFEDVKIPPREHILELAPRRRTNRTTKIKKCHRLVKELADSLYLIKDVNVLNNVEDELLKLVTNVKGFVPKDGGLPLIESPKRQKAPPEHFKPLPIRTYGRPKHPASQRVGIKADMLREEVWEIVEEVIPINKASPAHSEIVQDTLNATWKIINGIKLTYKDKLNIEGNEWLDDNVINACQYLISVQFPHVAGLCDTLLLAHNQVSQITQKQSIIQIHHVGAHWLVSHLSADDVIIYDSLKTSVNDMLKKQITNLYSMFFKGDFSILDLHCVTFQKQKGTNDCGPFAIANAVCLAYGISLSDVALKQTEMRAHLVKCLQEEEIFMFPHCMLSKSRAPVYSKKIRLSTFCLCLLYHPKIKMVECFTCKMWYHLKCVRLSQESPCVTTKEIPYICNKCSSH